MLTGLIFWHLIAHIIPVYFVVACGYGSVRFNLLQPVHYPGVNRFVSVLGIPFYAFHLMAFNDPYQISLRLVGADALQKLVVLTVGLLWWNFSKWGKIDHTINFFMLCTLPNTVLIGDALLDPLYGDAIHGKVVTIILMQAVLWYNLTITLYELRGVLLSMKTEESGNFAEKLGAPSRDGKNDTNAIEMNGKNFNQEANLARLPSALLTRTMSAPPACVSTISKVARVIHGSAVYNDDSRFLLNDRSRSSGSHRSHRPRSTRVKNWSPKTSMELDNEEAKDFENHMHQENITIADEESQPEEIVVGQNPEDPSKLKKSQKMVFAGKVTIKAINRLKYAPLMHGSILGFIYALIAYKYDWTMPYSVQTSLELLSNTALGMAIFILGMTWAISGQLVSCGWTKLLYGMFARFIIGPFIIIVAALIFGLKGDNYRFAVLQLHALGDETYQAMWTPFKEEFRTFEIMKLQLHFPDNGLIPIEKLSKAKKWAVIPQGVISFVLAKEYDLDSEEFATAVVFQLLVFIPVIVVYYFVLDSI